jgi:fluoroacetyl-CoA thioesterase
MFYSGSRQEGTAIHARGPEFMKDLPIGTKGESSLFITPEHLANRFKDAMLPPVLATPVMILIMENAALNALKPYLEPGESAVGTRVDVAHLAASPAGKSVKGEAEVVKVDGRRIEFKVRALHGDEEVGIGSHERMVIKLDRFNESLKKKFGI